MAALASAGSASALGFAYDDGQGGDFSVGTGATASVDGGATNSRAFAVSVIGDADAKVSGNGDNHTAVAVSVISPASSQISGGDKDTNGNGAYSLDGDTKITGFTDGVQVFQVGSDVHLSGPQSSNTLTIAACGTSFSGQADSVKAGACG